MKHILIVDDNKANLTAARAALCDICKVTAVTSGAQVLRFLEKNTCDLILLDINMPEADGFEVMEKIRASEGCSGIPIIFLTADDASETERRCFEAGAAGFITKPFTAPDLRSRLNDLL